MLIPTRRARQAARVHSAHRWSTLTGTSVLGMQQCPTGMAGALGPEGHWTEFLVHYRVTEVTQELQGAIKSDTQENRVFVFFLFFGVC